MRGRPHEATLRGLQAKLRDAGRIVRAGGEYDPWDLEVLGGLFGGSRMLVAVEEHAPGNQLLRFRISPRYSRLALATTILFAGMSILAELSGAWVPSAMSGFIAALV